MTHTPDDSRYEPPMLSVNLLSRVIPLAISHLCSLQGGFTDSDRTYSRETFERLDKLNDINLDKEEHQSITQALYIREPTPSLARVLQQGGDTTSKATVLWRNFEEYRKLRPSVLLGDDEPPLTMLRAECLQRSLLDRALPVALSASRSHSAGGLISRSLDNPLYDDTVERGSVSDYLQDSSDTAFEESKERPRIGTFDMADLVPWAVRKNEEEAKIAGRDGLLGCEPPEDFGPHQRLCLSSRVIKEFTDDLRSRLNFRDQSHRTETRYWSERLHKLDHIRNHEMKVIVPATELWETARNFASEDGPAKARIAEDILCLAAQVSLSNLTDHVPDFLPVRLGHGQFSLIRRYSARNGGPLVPSEEESGATKALADATQPKTAGKQNSRSESSTPGCVFCRETFSPGTLIQASIDPSDSGWAHLQSMRKEYRRALWPTCHESVNRGRRRGRTRQSFELTPFYYRLLSLMVLFFTLV